MGRTMPNTCDECNGVTDWGDFGPHDDGTKGTTCTCRPVTAQELGQALCRVFGLTPDRTTSLTITMDPNDVARVTVEQWVTQGQAAELIELATTYGLHKAPPRVTLGPGYTVHHQRDD